MLRFISYMKVKLKCVLCCLLTSTSIFFFFFALVLIVSSSWISLVEEFLLFLLGWFNSGFDDLCLVIGKCISCEHKKIEILLKEQIFEYTTKTDNRARNMKAQTCYQWRNISYLIYTLTQLKIIIIITKKLTSTSEKRVDVLGDPQQAWTVNPEVMYCGKAWLGAFPVCVVIGQVAWRVKDRRRHREYKILCFVPFINLLGSTLYCLLCFFFLVAQNVLYCIVYKVHINCFYNFNAVIVCVANKREYNILTKWIINKIQSLIRIGDNCWHFNSLIIKTLKMCSTIKLH